MLKILSLLPKFWFSSTLSYCRLTKKQMNLRSLLLLFSQNVTLTDFYIFLSVCTVWIRIDSEKMCHFYSCRGQLYCRAREQSTDSE